MNLFGTNYDKLIVAVLTIIVIIGNQMIGMNLGLSPVAQQWISLAVGVAGSVLTWATTNKNQPTLRSGQVVVQNTDIKPAATIVAAHKP